MGLTEVTAPTVEPLSIIEAKRHLRIEHNDSNVYISGLIKAARFYCERWCRRSFIETEWDMTLDHFPVSHLSGHNHTPHHHHHHSLERPHRGALNRDRAIRPQRSPLISVTSITYIDTDGVSQTLATTEYDVDTSKEPGRIAEAFDKTWPETRAQVNAVTVRYKAGYGTASTDVPETIRQAMLLLIGNWYENREDVVIGPQPRVLPKAVDSLLWMHRILEA